MPKKYKRRWHEVLYEVYRFNNTSGSVTSYGIANRLGLEVTWASTVLKRIHGWGFVTRRNIRAEVRQKSEKLFGYRISRGGIKKLRYHGYLR